MSQIGSIKIAHCQFTEDIVKDGRCIFDAVVALYHACRFKFGESKRVYKFFQRHAVLKTNGHRYGEIIHHSAETCALFMHIDENLTKRTIRIFTSAQIDFVAANNCLLCIALAALWHLFPMRLHDFFNNNFLYDFFSKNSCFFLCASTFKNFSSLIIVFNQCSRQRLGKF